MWYADDEAEDAFCCLGCNALTPGLGIVIGYDPERVVSVVCMLCNTLHELRRPKPAHTRWVGTSIEVELAPLQAQQHT